MSSSFETRKKHILKDLSRPDELYTDASPKGTIDAPIRDVIAQINSYSSLVTTSSCSGRVCVYVEGSGKGSKGHGGKWLFVSHYPLDGKSHEDLLTMNEIKNPDDTAGAGLEHKNSRPDTTGLHAVFGLEPEGSNGAGSNKIEVAEHTRYIHFKFEPLILHVLCSSASAANALLKVAQQAGFRESGAMNVPILSNIQDKSNGMDSDKHKSNDELMNVAIRSTGLALDSIIGFVSSVSDKLDAFHSLMTESYLDILVRISTARFAINLERLERFRSGLEANFGSGEPQSKETVWEDAEARRERKKMEGLKLRAAAQARKTQNKNDAREDAGNDDFDLLPPDLVASDLSLGHSDGE